jgi:hypothetical protein
MKNRKCAVLSLSNDCFKHYLLIRYATNTSEPGSQQFTYVSEENIGAEIWLQLYNYAKADLESHGGKLTGYEVINERILRHDGIKTDYWPSNWMWVISRQRR